MYRHVKSNYCYCYILLLLLPLIQSTICTIFTSVFQNSQNEEKKTITENRRRTKSREAWWRLKRSTSRATERERERESIVSKILSGMEIRWHRNANDNRFTAWRIQTRLEFTASNRWLINPRWIDRRQTDDEIPSGTCKLRIPMRETFHRISTISLEHRSSLTVMQISVYNSKGFLSPSPFAALNRVDGYEHRGISEMRNPKILFESLQLVDRTWS